MKALEYLICEGRLRELDLFRLTKMRCKGVLRAVSCYLKSSYRGDKLFSLSDNVTARPQVVGWEVQIKLQENLWEKGTATVG